MTQNRPKGLLVFFSLLTPYECNDCQEKHEVNSNYSGKYGEKANSGFRVRFFVFVDLKCQNRKYIYNYIF